ncbi:MAG TPA: hypothetical protein VFF69_07125 [Phycisphaerales bacterium]|nr:hypothetical protein [Phycisphaerales bacterium]
MNNTVKIIIIVVALAGAAVLIGWSVGGSKPSVEGRRTAYYVCSDPKCATEFEVEPGQSIAPPESPTEICPACKKDWPSRAAKCSACGRHTPMDGHGIAPEACPACGGGPMLTSGA